MAHVQRVGIPGAPRLVKNRADLADNDSKNFWNVPKNLASNGEWEEGEKIPNWLFEEFCNKAKIQFSTKNGRLF